MLDPKIKLTIAAAADRKAHIERACAAFADLLEIMAYLRGSTGCPWDAEQSLASLRQYVREEADEVCDALDQILDFEDQLRDRYRVPLADPTPPQAADKARTATKGLTIAHHPHRPDFDPAASASGAPRPIELTAEEAAQLDALYAALADELGDFMLQGAFIGDILLAMGRGGVERSLEFIIEKLVRRHPHVFGDRQVADSAEVLSNWEEIKRGERS